MGLIAYVFAATMLGTTLPTPLYPSYERMFMFGQLTETVVFATYALGVLVTLLLLGEGIATHAFSLPAAGQALAGLIAVIAVATWLRIARRAATSGG